MKVYKLQFFGTTHVYYELYSSLEAALKDRLRILKTFSTSETNLYVGEANDTGRFEFKKMSYPTQETI